VDWEVYVRRGQRIDFRFPPEPVVAGNAVLDVAQYKSLVCLDLATIQIEERYRHQGFFKAVLETMVRLNPWDGVFLENVSYNWLNDYVKSLPGWHDYSTAANCYIYLRK
jgi:hypothetical protein